MTDRTTPDDSEARLAASLPPTVKEQPDPMLQMSTGRMGAGGITLFAVAAVVILGVVLYGLNGKNPEGAAPPPAAASAPAGTGKPAPPSTTAPQKAPAQPAQNGPGSNP